MSTQDEYSPPKVWTWEQESGGTFASINRPIAGATHDKDLPRGEHPLQLHSMGTPNGLRNYSPRGKRALNMMRG